jgi:hypothetical protein
MMETICYLAAIVLIVGFFVTARKMEMEAWMVERKELLDRIMSRDYEQYAGVNIKVNESRAPTKVVSVDELTKMMEDREQSQGIPI